LQEQADRLKGLIQFSANYGDVKMLNRLAQTANRVKYDEIEELESGLVVELDTIMYGQLKAVLSSEAPDPDLSDFGNVYGEDN
jgi:hypothetical protein